MSRERSALWTSSTVKYVKPNGCPTGIGPASGLGSAGPEASKSVGGEELENKICFDSWSTALFQPPGYPYNVMRHYYVGNAYVLFT